MEAIKIIKESIKTHEDWADYFERNPHIQSFKEYKRLGDAKFHRGYIERYNQAITEIEQLQANNDRQAKEITRLTDLAVKNDILTGEKERLKAELTKLQESDAWMKSATEFYEGGNCPVCFESDEAGHKKGCYIGEIEDESGKLKEFARRIIQNGSWDFSRLDGGDIQDLAEKHGLIVSHTATEEDIAEDSEYEVGDIIYKFSEILKG